MERKTIRSVRNGVVDRSQYYTPQNRSVDGLCVEASQSFAKGEKEQAVTLYKDALAKSAVGSFDRAYVLRRLANTIINKTFKLSDEELFEVRDYLEEAIKLHQQHNSGPSSIPIESTEYQRCLALICNHVFNNINDCGPLLEQHASILRKQAEAKGNFRYLYDAHNALYIAKFAEGKLADARKHIAKCIELGELHELKPATAYRHLAKVILLQIKKDEVSDGLETVYDNFWKCYDAHKRLPWDPQRARLLKVDLNLLFFIEVFKNSDHPKAKEYKQCLEKEAARKNKKPNTLSPREYIKREASKKNLSGKYKGKKYLGPNDVENLMAGLDVRIQSLQQGKPSPLAKQLFPEVEPPSFFDHDYLERFKGMQDQKMSKVSRGVTKGDVMPSQIVGTSVSDVSGSEGDDQFQELSLRPQKVKATTGSSKSNDQDSHKARKEHVISSPCVVAPNSSMFTHGSCVEAFSLRGQTSLAAARNKESNGSSK
jgi:hypothetical protein